MIRVLEVNLEEKRERRPIYGGPVITAMTRTDTQREVVIRLRIDDGADIDRIHRMLMDLSKPDETVRADIPDVLALPT